MKQLSSRQKDFLYNEVARGRLRWVAKPFYDALIGTELLFHRFIDLFSAKDQSDVSSVTAIIKTFERPYAVKRLVRSIKRRYPGLAVIVVDDSKKAVSIKGVELLRMPYDTGISAGRNEALDQIRTSYFLLLDDDFVFSHRQNLGELIRFMDSNPEVDILGGRYIDLPLYTQLDFQNTALYPSANQPVIAPGTVIGEHVVVNKVQNFFIGRTETVRSVKWNPELKVREHTEFFTRACGQLVTVFHSGMKILHAKTPFDNEYLKFRYRK